MSGDLQIRAIYTTFTTEKKQTMTFSDIYIETLGVKAEYSAFAPKEGVAEWHVMLHVDPRNDLFAGQLERIYAAEAWLMEQEEFKGASYVMKRYFLSDSTNQMPLMRHDESCSISCIQQQPLDGSKVAAWLYLQKGTQVSQEQGTTVVSHNGYCHLWKTGMTCSEGDSAAQTEALLNEYENTLKQFGATIEANCIRTWFYVRDVDTQYAGMVKARRENFTLQGLTEHTHYISSTGIGGLPADTKALVQLGTYALTGFEPSQQRYLYAPTHLNPTYEYGVTFERGTRMEYGDRTHLIISGTASIDNKGNVLHVGDIVKQAQRMCENVETLLAEGEASFNDVMQIIIYLRDTADYETVKQFFSERFPHIPSVITLAPVCRPTWLIEMECWAVKENHNAEYRNF